MIRAGRERAALQNFCSSTAHKNGSQSYASGQKTVVN